MPLSQKVDLLVDVAEMLQQGESSTGLICSRFSVSRKTAILYRNEAMKLIRDEDKALTRDNLRNLEAGRLRYWIEWLQKRINEAYDGGDKELATKLLQRLEGFSARYHAITGLNEININTTETKRTVKFVINADAKPQDKHTPTLDGDAN